MTNSNKLLVDIYRSKKKEGMYLYLKRGEQLTDLPETLQKIFGKGEFSMSLLLHAQRKLANAEVANVMQSIADTGYYLQLPPKPEISSSIRNDKLPLNA